MRVLNRKLWRDLWEMRAMVLAIALVQVGGIATFVMSLSTYDSLLITRDNYYQEQRFADVFATTKRAPNSMVERVQGIPGVEQVQTRVIAAARLSVPGFSIRQPEHWYPSRTIIRHNSTHCTCVAAACLNRVRTMRSWSTRPLPMHMACSRVTTCLQPSTVGASS